MAKTTKKTTKTAAQKKKEAAAKKAAKEQAEAEAKAAEEAAAAESTGDEDLEETTPADSENTEETSEPEAPVKDKSEPTPEPAKAEKVEKKDAIDVALDSYEAMFEGRLRRTEVETNNISHAFCRLALATCKADDSDIYEKVYKRTVTGKHGILTVDPTRVLAAATSYTEKEADKVNNMHAAFTMIREIRRGRLKKSAVDFERFEEVISNKFLTWVESKLK